MRQMNTDGESRAARGRPMIALGEDPPDWLVEAVRRGGGHIGPLAVADAFVHRGRAGALPTLPPSIRWVQLPGAGIEAYVAAGALDESRVWTSAAGAYADTVAEHAVGLLLAGVRGLVTAAHLRSWQPRPVASAVTGLSGCTVAVVGAGGIGRRIIELLAPFRVTVVAVNRRGRPVPGAGSTVPVAEIDRVWDEVDHVIVAAPATPASRQMIGTDVLARLRPHSWVVNIARGSLIDTDALTEAVADGHIAGAALDVTDPEPLPNDHPLWHTPGVLITPHTANPPAFQQRALADRVSQNVARFAAGRELLGVVDLGAGY